VKGQLSVTFMSLTFICSIDISMDSVTLALVLEMNRLKCKLVSSSLDYGCINNPFVWPCAMTFGSTKAGNYVISYHTTWFGPIRSLNLLYIVDYAHMHFDIT